MSNQIAASVKVQTIVFTGEAPFETRQFWKNMAQEAGHIVKDSVTSKTTLVVASYLAAKEGTTKWLKANELGVPVMSYGEFIDNLA